MTQSYAKHKATDDLYEKLSSLMDAFVETYIGKYQRPKMNELNIKISCMNDTQMLNYLKKQCDFLIQELPKFLQPEKDMDLLNIRDELLANLYQTIYLFSLS
jgi:hypothetical protein